MRRTALRDTLYIALLWGCGGGATADAAVKVVRGPTAIPDGEATAAGDLTISNERLAFALAVESPAPFGVPRGAIVDMTPVVDGKPQRDRVVFADFVPDNWAAWPSRRQQVEVVERGPQQAVVRTTRDWGDVEIETTYTLRAGVDRIELATTMTNRGTTVVSNVLSGQTLWPSAGYFFGVPGLDELQEGAATGALTDRVVAYDADWSITLHASYMDYVGNRSKDVLRRHSLAPGESRRFDAWFQVGARGDLAPVVAAEIERTGAAAGTVAGSVVANDGKPVAEPVVVISKQGKPYAWAVGEAGRYSVALPAGSYELYATGAGYSQSRPLVVEVAPSMTRTLDFADVAPPGRVVFTVADAHSGEPLDARIAIVEGQQPLVEYLGRSTFFTELDDRGRLETALAPGPYRIAVTAGGVFRGAPAIVALEVRPGAVQTQKLALGRLFDPAAAGWVAAALHHHADQAEGITPPIDLARSQLAAGLDLLFVSDHDSTANHAILQRIADRRGVPFIPSLELSPSWGHFNAWPLRPGLPLAIDTSIASVDEVLAEARRQGAIVVQANHPLIPYGYFSSLRAGLAPGGFNAAFDLAEINADVPFDQAVLQEMHALWNAGHRYYLSGGTDVHDVWNHESGRLRTYARVDGPVSPVSYAQAVTSGHAYVSYGPLIYPSVMFGTDLKVKRGAAFTLSFDLQAVAGLKQARLIGADGVAASRAFEGAPRETKVEFPLSAQQPTWYALEVEDTAGRQAFTNPVWIDPVIYPPPDSAP
ncbi:MAG: CehA/McbA family metallohydrolase [Steroidobacteraceae bacterium]